MRGDFSSWRKELGQNFNGVLHQQGRVLLDSDWNAQTRITNDWQDTAGQDIIGAGVVAVPADQPNAFKVTQAQIVGSEIKLQVGVGRVWDDGLLVNLYGANPTDATVTRTATYLEPPIQNPVPANPAPPPTVRDAVVLEVWREEINGFQLPDPLMEPALGGVDTTERAHTAMAFRLLRLSDGETCESIAGKLKDIFPNKGKLTVKLEPDAVTSGDCPVVAGGGYTGFEHNLYRIEIARVSSGLNAMFKWSQFNGGLVGRGTFDSVTRKITITANKAAIASSGLNDFYLEAIAHDTALGHWRVIYGAKVSLNSDDSLTANPTPVFGAMPTTTGNDTLFFRLWNDVRLISDFVGEQPLQDGIRLQFDPVAVGKYAPGDYWTFDVRAGEITNPQPLIANQPPTGIYHHRAPLGVITWNSATGVIADCRRIFPPLTRLATCCSYRVGDGKQSHGDFTSIQEALNHLPASGGEICVLPGLYEENVTVANKHDITIKGCGARSRVRFKTNAPVIHVRDSQRIRIEGLSILAHELGVGVLLEGPETVRQNRAALRDVTLDHLSILAQARSAIEAQDTQSVTIRACHIEMGNVTTEWAGIYFVGDDALLVDNEILIGALAEVRDFSTPVAGIARVRMRAHGGLHLGGGCDRVRVINNLIQGGAGNGITLGSVDEEQTGAIVRKRSPWRKVSTDTCAPRSTVLKRGATVVVEGAAKEVAGPVLSEILIERNRIFEMGMNGIGVDTFFDLSGADEMIAVERLTIIGNEIRDCLSGILENIEQGMADSAGYGGIALADVESLIVRDNVIADNGTKQAVPICGIFVLHCEGLEIARNRILNNGARSEEARSPTRFGRRGGINIVFALAPKIPPEEIDDRLFSIANGVPAAKIHGNIVSAPVGQALVLGAVGPVSVVNNQFTSLGVVPRITSVLDLASTVLIFNLGFSIELLGLLAGLLLKGLAKTQVSRAGGSQTSLGTTTAARPGLDDMLPGRYLANGNVLFSDNQCELNLLDRNRNISISSILIVTLDDIGFHHNQCDCDLLLDFAVFDALLMGFTLRVTDNRFKETPLHAAASALTLGLMLNKTADNQSTHCLYCLPRGSHTINVHNRVLLEVLQYPINAKDRYSCPGQG